MGRGRGVVGTRAAVDGGEGPGRKVVDAIADAAEVGVAVEVGVDDAGQRYGETRSSGVLRKRGIRIARFLPMFAPWRWPYMNLRNHRKLLVVDGVEGFTGGLNIRPDHVLADAPKSPTHDVPVLSLIHL